MLRDWLEFVVQGLVDRPEDVEVIAIPQAGQTLYELRVHPDDVGQVIGRRGATINALRALAQAGAAKQGEKVAVDLVDDDEPASRRRRD
jgi:predicted RNA-binding protein YlqC (UPF0109 family)